MQRHIFATFLVLFVAFFPMFSQTILFTQSGNANDNWTYTSTGADATATAQALMASNFTSAPQSIVVGGNTGGGSCIDGGSGNGPSVQRTFTFDDVNIGTSNQLNRTLSFKWGNRHPVCTGTGWDTGENLIFIPIHNGVQQANQTLGVGLGDALFPIQQSSFSYTVPPCVNTFGFILYVTTNRRDELLFLDDVVLSTNGFNQTLTPNIVNQSVCQNQLPLSWNGQQLTTAGTYNATLTSATGCDSLVQLNLSILPSSQSNQQLSICQNELPLMINGISITAAGTYVLNYLNVSGCDSVVNLTVSLLPAQQSFQQVTICENELPLVINNTNITTSGTYDFNFQTGSGCDSIATFVVIINQVQQSNQTLALCPQDLPFVWNGQQITATGTYTANFTAANGCDSSAVLNFTLKPVPTVNVSADNNLVYLDNPTVNFINNSSNFDQFSWNFGDGTPVNSVNAPSHTFPTNPGTYIVIATATLNNCSASSSITIVVEVDAGFTFILPNVFTPNEDGSNENFTNQVENSEAMELIVLNRWGGLVFQTNEASDSWNGKDQNTGVLCSEGVYFYKLTITDKAGEIHVFNSFVHLLR